VTTSIVVPVLLLPDKDRELTRFTEACFASMRMHLSDYELVVVDNGSPVDALWLSEQADVYIRNEDNRGFAVAVNQGLAAANGEWLCVCNDDITFINDWLADAQAAWGECTGAVSSHLHDHDPEHKAGRQVAVPGMMFGALWLTRREVVEAVGGLDEGYERGMFEDKAWYQTVRAAGYELVKAGWCRHVGNATWGKLPDQHAIYVRNMKRYQERWG
jgi:GT2 family glycosyltransferase